MRAVLQRVSRASVLIAGKSKASIGQGLLVLLGIVEDDHADDIEWLSGKISRMRIFNDSENLMNLSVHDIHGEILVVSQFTLYASTKKGNRPSFIKAARPETAMPLYENFIKKLSFDSDKQVQSGEFGAFMEVSLVNDGPVTIIIDSKSRE
jgi:D-tyrosyl-tRNA(Tyr) deacylase